MKKFLSNDVEYLEEIFHHFEIDDTCNDLQNQILDESAFFEKYENTKQFNSSSKFKIKLVFALSKLATRFRFKQLMRAQLIKKYKKARKNPIPKKAKIPELKLVFPEFKLGGKLRHQLLDPLWIQRYAASLHTHSQLTSQRSLVLSLRKKTEFVVYLCNDLYLLVYQNDTCKYKVDFEICRLERDKGRLHPVPLEAAIAIDRMQLYDLHTSKRVIVVYDFSQVDSVILSFLDFSRVESPHPQISLMLQLQTKPEHHVFTKEAGSDIQIWFNISNRGFARILLSQVKSNFTNDACRFIFYIKMRIYFTNLSTC